MIITINPETDMFGCVDVEGAFLPGGGLAVPRGEEVVPVIRDRILPLFPRARRFATRDVHPYGHICLASSFVGCSPFDVLSVQYWMDLTADERHTKVLPHALFAPRDVRSYLVAVRTQILWPDHALDGTPEVKLHPDIPESRFDFVQVKGMDPREDSYSGFKGNAGTPTGLAERLRQRRMRRGFLGGLAFEYCVGFTGLDGVDEGFEMYILEDATRSIGGPDDPAVIAMRQRLREKGVHVIQSTDLRAA